MKKVFHRAWQRQCKQYNDIVIIRFLRNCETNQNYTQTHCECCGPEPMGPRKEFFYKGQEENPDILWKEIDISTLKYKEDYEIIEYP